MSGIDYHKKYLKYKAKYLELKSKQNKVALLVEEVEFKRELTKSLEKLEICMGSKTLPTLEELLKTTNQLNKRGLEIVLNHFNTKKPIEELVSSLSPSNRNNLKALELARKFINSCSAIEKGMFRTKIAAASAGQSISKKASEANKLVKQGSVSLIKSAKDGVAIAGDLVKQGSSVVGDIARQSSTTIGGITF